MTRCPIDEAEKANDPPDRLQDYASPDRHQFREEQVEIDYDEEDTNKKVDDLTKLFNRLKSNKVDSLFDVVPKIDNLPREKMNIRRWEK